jgi:tetratricopeptide (TPR) repeat protein
MLSNSLKNIRDIHFEGRHLDQTLVYFHQLLKRRFKELSFGDPILSDTYQILGNISIEKGDLDEALIYFHQLLNNELNRKTLEDPSLTDIYQIIGIIFFQKRYYNHALIFIYRFIDCQLQKQIIDDSSIDEAYIIIGKIFLEKHLFKYFDDDSNNRSQKSSLVKNFLINIYQIVNNIHFEIHYINQSLIYYHNQLDQQLNTRSHLLDKTYFILGCIYLEKHYFNHAIFHFIKSIEYQIKKNHFGDSLLADTYTLLGITYHQQGLIQQALQDYQRALDIYTTVYPITHQKIIKIKKKINYVLLSKSF